MININYTVNFGNCLFQYAFARLHAELNGLNLNTEFKFKNILNTTPHKKFDTPNITNHTDVSDQAYYIYRSQHGSNVIPLSQQTSYNFTGFFQDADIFNKNRDVVKSFFEIPKFEINKTDTLVTFRLGDFIHTGSDSEIIHYEWYNEVLKNMPGKKILQICDYRYMPEYTDQFSNKEQEKRYIEKIAENHDCEVHYMNPNTQEDFYNYFRYNNIVCSNSTFAWWGCFLSEANNIITFTKTGLKGTVNPAPHGIHVNNLYNVKNISVSVDGDFFDITKL
jgi:hypothetical protein